MSDDVYSRAPKVVWRLGPDRVLVRRVGSADDVSTAELSGAAALVWVALDEPGSSEELVRRLACAENVSELDAATVESGAAVLCDEGLVFRVK